MEKRSIVLFRKDFRLYDHPALFHAAQAGKVLPVYIYDEKADGTWSIGAAAKWWLHHAITDVKTRLLELDTDLIIRTGDTLFELQTLIKETNATAVYWNTRYEPHMIEKDMQMAQALQQQGIHVDTFSAHLLLEPWTVHKQNGEPYKVFTAFYKAMQHYHIPIPTKKLSSVQSFGVDAPSLQVEELGLLPHIPWTAGMEKAWIPTEAGAYEQLRRFLSHGIKDYEEGRNIPSTDNHSSLAPYFAFGQLSARFVYHYIQQKWLPKQQGLYKHQVESFLRQLVWRDFAYHLLHHFPHTTTKPLYEAFQAFPWENNEELLQLWQQGKTGYPIVDAGMRELWTTGFMHNRVRMIAASFLVKHLLIPWQHGAAWFWETLLDADLANNTMGWQWVAGSGADASPYFRIFNPITQGEKFDKRGEYVRKWVPELQGLPDKYIHKPWEAPKELLDKANIILGTTYPKPVVEHGAARQRALGAYEAMKKVL